MTVKKKADPIPKAVLAILVEQLRVDEATVTLDCKLAEDLGADSLDIIETCMKFEEEFKVDLQDDHEELFDTGTLGEILDVLRAKGVTL